MENNQFEENRLLFVKQVETFLSQEMLSEALGLAQARLSLIPGDVDARTFIILALITMGRIEESRPVLQELEKDIVKLSVAFLRAAEASRGKGLNKDAVSCYQKFLSLNPFAENSREVAEEIALLQTEDSLDGGVAESNNAAVPGPEFFTQTLADLYIKQGHPLMATDILTEIIKREPANIQVREKLATLKAALALKSPSGKTDTPTDNLIKTLSSWLENIGRLKKHAT
jgi:tetratricopeptide (TPR) repeat protein